MSISKATIRGLPKLCAFVSTAEGVQVKCDVEMVLSPYQLMPMYKAKAQQGHPFDGQRKIIVPISRIRFTSQDGELWTKQN